MRRGMPASPKKCIGIKVTLTPMNMVQNWILPRIAGYWRPDILPNQ